MFWTDVIFEVIVFVVTGLLQIPLTVLTDALLSLLSAGTEFDLFVACSPCASNGGNLGRVQTR